MWSALGPYAKIPARTEIFEANNVALPDAHAGAAVEPGGAGDALGIDAETDFANIAPMVLGESVAEEGETEPAVSPRTAYSDDVDPSLAGERLAEGDARYCVGVHGQKPEGGIEALLFRHPGESLERAARPSPHVPEGVLDGLEGRLLVLVGDEGTDGDALWPVRLGKDLVQFGLHHVHPAHRRVAEIFQ
jgi:hypothetical protein